MRSRWVTVRVDARPDADRHRRSSWLGRGARRSNGAAAVEGGMVTAEIATVLPAVVALTLGLACVVGAVGAQLRCADLARESVRALARGESAGSVRARVLADAPPGATVTVRRSGGMVTATVRARAPVVGTDLLRVPGVRVGSAATAADEKDLAAQPW